MSDSTKTTPATVYKILSRSDWEAAVECGAYRGSPDDKRDGFIHLSALHQLGGTAAKYFKGLPDLMLIGYSSKSLGDALKWETSRGGDLFPHLYGDLPTNNAHSIHELQLDDDGVPQIPQGLS